MILKQDNDLIVFVTADNLNINVGTESKDVSKILFRVLAKVTKYDTRSAVIDAIHSDEFKTILASAMGRALTEDDIKLIDNTK